MKARSWSSQRAGCRSENERRAREYAEEVARRGLVAVPEGWRGPEGARRVGLVATMPVSAEQLQAALGDSTLRDELAVLVVVPTLAQGKRLFRLGDATEAVEHAEPIVVIRRRAQAKRYLENVPLQPAAEAFHVPLTEVSANGGT